MNSHPTKIIYFGTPDFAVPPLASLIADKSFDVEAVITRKDKKVGRKQILTAPPVKIFALENSTPVFQPPSLKDSEFINLIKEIRPDFIIVAAYGKILPQSILDIPKFGCVNIHGSLLPNYRGASPIEEALRKGDKETGITFMKMNEKLDAGPVYQLQRININEDDDSITLRDKLSTLAAIQLPFILKDILDGVLEPLPQDESKATYCGKINKEDGLIRFTKMTAEEIINNIKAFTIWPNCHFNFGDKTIKILNAVLPDSNICPQKSEAGTIYVIDKKTAVIGTKKGCIQPVTIQPEGKKPMPFSDFLRGTAQLPGNLP